MQASCLWYRVGNVESRPRSVREQTTVSYSHLPLPSSLLLAKAFQTVDITTLYVPKIVFTVLLSPKNSKKQNKPRTFSHSSQYGNI